ncbi:replication initiation protein RepC [Phyllobacterium sp. 21LDTY02-6]|uniref:plasmid replication protein RepC n=1 Tax=Phyllobacterium sp. 21LDTY02-6 TaxID=2944903 RepID=UPI0020229115|nr:plasmid replication protein RepC [Phyllobacterium sp. 21LDTY02-6]MCO4319051.1 replication initiation protein RepC [Phyllobacterium sp. 21LDTY02-6]
MQAIETITSAFRGRKMSFAQLRASSSQESKEKSNAVDRWLVYKQLCIAKSVFGINDRCLAVLSSLLSFYPENEICEKNGLVVFPSNRQLALRAHGMPESTLRRHLASLVDAGLIARRDSPNGKRYSYKNRAGVVEEAFGFSFEPLLERAKEIARAAETVQADALLLKRTREQVSLQRRDLGQLIDAALVEDTAGQWTLVHKRLRAIVDAIPRRASQAELQAILGELARLRADVDNLLKTLDDTQELSANDAQNERQHIESLPESHIKSKNSKMNDFTEPLPSSNALLGKPNPTSAHITVPLDVVLRACPDIRDYSPSGVSSWRDLIDATQIVSRCLGIAQSAYSDARLIMGTECLSAVIAWILQRSSEITCAGGYLRSLTQKARRGEFAVSQLLMSGLRATAR